MPLGSAWFGWVAGTVETSRSSAQGGTCPACPGADAALGQLGSCGCRSGLRRSCRRSRCGLVGHRQVPGPPCQGLAPPGDVIIGKELSGELVGRTEETLEAETEEPLIVPVGGNDAFIQQGEGLAYGRVLQLGHATPDGDEIHHDLLFPAA